MTPLTELTTAATDAVLAVECAVISIWMLRRAGIGDGRARRWAGLFALMATASLLGAAAHGLPLTAAVRDLLWHPLYLCLGLAVALVLVAAVADWRGAAAARRLLPSALAVGVLFYLITQMLGGAFALFVIYQAVALSAALALYLRLAMTARLRGAGTIALGIVITLAAAAVQTSGLSLQLGLPLDHNGLYHLAQMVGVAVLAAGVARGLATP